MRWPDFFAVLFFFIISGCSSPSKDFAKNVDKQKAAKLNVELGLHYLEQKQMARAKEKLNRAKALASTLPEVHYAYGYYWEEVGENKEAEKAYQKAIYLNAKNGNAHHSYGAFLCRQRRYYQAEKEFLLAIKDPHYTKTAETLENIGLCLLQVPEREKALHYLKKALRYDPTRESTQHLLAEIQNSENRDQNRRRGVK